jgi:hypothetical protein
MKKSCSVSPKLEHRETLPGYEVKNWARGARKFCKSETINEE